jgi:hypothetical protein
MCNIRVNRITVNVDKKYDDVKISLYKTNELLGVLTEDDLDLPPFSKSNVSIKAYQMYCKDLVIELLNNDGIPGYYYEPKSENQSIKYDQHGFKSGVGEYVESIIGDKYVYTMPMTERFNVIERYKDGYIKDATAEIDVRLTQYDIKIVILAEIKSGQLCRPKVMKHNNVEYSFNITNVGRIIKLVQ